MSKIAVQCETADEWDAVVKKAGKADSVCTGKQVVSNYKTINKYCIMLDGRFNPKRSCISDGYTIISAADYLKEGEVEEVDQEKLCEFCRDHYELPSDSVHFMCEGRFCEDALELYLEDNPTIKKENKMKNNDINKNVAAVFSNKSGEELLLVDKHYSQDMMDRILMEIHKVAILKACKTAEADLLKEDK